MKETLIWFYLESYDRYDVWLDLWWLAFS